MDNGKVLTRIAPSPTGLLHVGTARAALYNYLFARKHGGSFLVRIEDTDRARSTKEYEQDILQGFERLGLTYDGLVTQSKRVEVHTERLKELVARDVAYVSEEPAKDDPDRTVEVVRLRNPGTRVTFTDLVRGDVTFDTAELGDFVIARSITDPLYHFAVVVDDADMHITHVIRGEDHISNTPRQILIQEALGVTRPQYAHLPLLLAADRSKLSKRKGAVSVREYLEEGYLPEALINFLALLGWNPGTAQEIFTLAELVTAFDLAQVQKGGAVFDLEKLKWMNREHRRRLPREQVRDEVCRRLERHQRLVGTFRNAPQALNDALERFATYGELVRAVELGEFRFYEERPDPDPALLPWKKDPSREETARRLRLVRSLLADIEQGHWTEAGLEEHLTALVEQEGKGHVLWPLRVALSGKERSPAPFLLLEALGKDEALARIDVALAALAV